MFDAQHKFRACDGSSNEISFGHHDSSKFDVFDTLCMNMVERFVKPFAGTLLVVSFVIVKCYKWRTSEKQKELKDNRRQV